MQSAIGLGIINWGEADQFWAYPRMWLNCQGCVMQNTAQLPAGQKSCTWVHTHTRVDRMPIFLFFKISRSQLFQLICSKCLRIYYWPVVLVIFFLHRRRHDKWLGSVWFRFNRFLVSVGLMRWRDCRIARFTGSRCSRNRVVNQETYVGSIIWLYWSLGDEEVRCCNFKSIVSKEVWEKIALITHSKFSDFMLLD